MQLQDKVKKFPLSPGVYIWLDKNQKPLYVGRATSLRRRVLQYFRKDIYPVKSPQSGVAAGEFNRVNPRIGEMVGLAKKIKWQATDTVLESVILEANLIKKYWPKYNVKDRDNRSFVYIVIPRTSPRLRTASFTDFPRPIIARGRELDKFLPSQTKVFGPYQSLTVVRNALKIIRRIFPYSVCRFTGKPCFDYQIGLCPGVCVGVISKQDYQKNINNIILLLRGEKNRLLKKLAKENPEAAAALKHIQDVTLISRDPEPQGFRVGSRIEAYDVSHFAGREVYGSMAVFADGKPDKSQYRLFRIKTATNNDLEALKEMIERRFNHPEWPKPGLILVDGGKPQVGYIFKFLEQRRIAVPLLGISKLNGDRLVFPPRTKNVFKELAESIKTTLQAARDEAHRFANRGRSRGYFRKNLPATDS